MFLSQFDINIVVVVLCVSGLAIAFWSIFNWQRWGYVVGLILALCGLGFGIFSNHTIKNQQIKAVQTQINKSKTALAVNQTQINQSIHDLHVNHDNGDAYREIQAKYYSQTQVQRRLQNRLNQQEPHLLRLKNFHHDLDN